MQRTLSDKIFPKNIQNKKLHNDAKKSFRQRCIKIFLSIKDAAKPFAQKDAKKCFLQTCKELFQTKYFQKISKTKIFTMMQRNLLDTDATKCFWHLKDVTISVQQSSVQHSLITYLHLSTSSTFEGFVYCSKILLKITQFAKEQTQPKWEETHYE